MYRILYWAAVCSSASLRVQVVKMRISRFPKLSIKFFLTRYLLVHPKKSEILQFLGSRPLGDWFLLKQLSKNLNRAFFLDFLR